MHPDNGSFNLNWLSHAGIFRARPNAYAGAFRRLICAFVRKLTLSLLSQVPQMTQHSREMEALEKARRYFYGGRTAKRGTNRKINKKERKGPRFLEGE